ncbi:MAG: hypothetical protein U9N52_01850 [Campylobacterota bacterium]|nr:hypothetical protein [Campylobacterota bacterium]
MKFLLFFLPIILGAQILQVGDLISPVSLESQHEKRYLIKEEQYWIITWDKETTREANTFIEKYPDILEKYQAVMIVDVSQVPSGIFSLFVKPRMQYYAHPILLSFDTAYNLTLPYQEGKLTLLSLKNKKIRAIDFIDDAVMLKQFLPSKRLEKPFK